MKIEELHIKGCFLIKPHVFYDERGCFFESFNQAEFNAKTNLNINFVQDNQSISSRGVLRGLHFQKGKYAQAKLLSVAKGKVLDIIVDIRLNSQTYGEHFIVELSSENKIQLFIPRGFAHGFIALEEDTIFCYKCDNYYNAESESGIRFDDPELDIEWNCPKEEMLLSRKDLALPFFKELHL